MSHLKDPFLISLLVFFIVFVCLYWVLLCMEKCLGGTLWRVHDDADGHSRFNWHWVPMRGDGGHVGGGYMQRVDNPEYVEIDTATMVSMV